MKDEYGWPICASDIRRRPDLKDRGGTKHDVWRFSGGVKLTWHPEIETVCLCINCKSWVTEEGEFINTI